MLKIDCHRHLGGCIPPAFVWEVIQRHNLKHLGESLDDVQSQMTFGTAEPFGFHRFLGKFKILDEIKWTEELIDESIQAICLDLQEEGIGFAWLDFSINKYMTLGWHKHEAVKFIHDSFERHYPGGVGLILSLKYESMRASQRQYAKLIEHEIATNCLIGLDLVGDEEYFDAAFYQTLFADWNAAGKITRAHVGESQASANIERAITDLHVTNIAHGFKIVDHPEMVAIAKERGITFDTAITSNYLTGVWNDWKRHPSVEMLRAGLRVTLGSDDPVQCSTTLDAEFNVAMSLGWTDDELAQSQSIALENSRQFLSLR